MTLAANALVSLADAKIFLGIPSGNTTSDALVESFINEASSLIERYCNRKFRSATYTEEYDGGGISEILLNQWPVTSITSVHASSSRVFDSTTLLGATTYGIAYNEQGEGITIERFSGAFPRGRKTVKVVYVAGYSALSDVPADLQLAAKITVAFYYRKQQEKDWTTSTIQKGDENVSLIQGLPESATLILANHVRLEMLAPPEPLRNP